MTGKTNVGGRAISAIIAVRYPEGSVCTCTNGTRTLKAKDTGGTALFNVNIGTWTVTAKDESAGKEKSQSVEITADGQAETITLAYELVIFDNGLVDGYTWDSNCSVSTTLSISLSDSTGYGKTKSGYSLQTIDFSDYSTLHFYVVSGTSTASYARTATAGVTNASVSCMGKTDTEVTVDITNITSDKIKLYVECNSATHSGTDTTTLKISKIWAT